LIGEHGISDLQASKITRLARSRITYEPRSATDDDPWITLLAHMVEQHPGIWILEELQAIAASGSCD